MTGNLDDHVGIWDVDASVTNSWENDCVYFIPIPEVRNYILSFSFSNFTTNERDLESVCINFKRENMITENNDFVTPTFMNSS